MPYDLWLQVATSYIYAEVPKMHMSEEPGRMFDSLCHLLRSTI